jgi:hypothetical protein
MDRVDPESDEDSSRIGSVSMRPCFSENEKGDLGVPSELTVCIAGQAA